MRNFTALALFFGLNVVCSSALAAGGHGLDHATTVKIIWQLFNIVVLFVGVIYFFGANIRSAFAARHENYLRREREAQETLHQARMRKSEIQQRLQKIESSRQESLSRAHAEAADLKASLIEEAKHACQRMRLEHEATQKMEVTKAVSELRKATLGAAVDSASSELRASSSGVTKSSEAAFLRGLERAQ